MPEISVTKILRTDKQTKKTVNDISPACLSACGDNKFGAYSCVVDKNDDDGDYADIDADVGVAASE